MFFILCYYYTLLHIESMSLLNAQLSPCFIIANSNSTPYSNFIPAILSRLFILFIKYISRDFDNTKILLNKFFVRNLVIKPVCVNAALVFELGVNFSDSTHLCFGNLRLCLKHWRSQKF